VKVSPETVLQIAALANLHVDTDELPRMQHDLEAILGYVEQLSELDLTGVSPTASVVDIPTPMRSDDALRTLPNSEVVRNAPMHAKGSYVVPKVIE
jgi:aspartyl-tRNA(Asn)/glutamyl-tRNA(Gln) amidotransferase subunit C